MPKVKLPVFKAEREAGIAEAVQASASFAYVTKLEDVNISQEALRSFLRPTSTASLEDQFDLFYLNTILVSTGWNKNDDVFDKLPTWLARYTPVHKQFNLEHDQSKIIGHMTTAKAVTEDYAAISDDISIDDLPDKFHILTGAVIYRALADEEAQQQIEKIIEEIHGGKWYVSMECLFRDFDYAVIGPDGSNRIVARNEDSAFLTKHLRRYGGSGKFSLEGRDYSIGRSLKNITFSGKGLVRQPANPDSIIFNDVSKFKATLGYISTSDNGDYTITDFSKPKHQSGTFSMANEVNVDKFEKELAELREENKSLKETVKEHESSATTNKIKVLEDGLAAKAAKLTELEGELNVANVKVADLEGKLASANERAERAEKELNEAKAAELVRARVEKLTKLNASEAEAKSLVTLFADKNDKDFDTIVALFSDKWTKKEKEGAAKAGEASTDKLPAKHSADVLDSAEPEEDAPISAGSQTNEEVEPVRQAMAAIFAQILDSELTGESE